MWILDSIEMQFKYNKLIQMKENIKCYVNFIHKKSKIVLKYEIQDQESKHTFVLFYGTQWRI